jgi:hypothetical protein
LNTFLPNFPLAKHEILNRLEKNRVKAMQSIAASYRIKKQIDPNKDIPAEKHFYQNFTKQSMHFDQSSSIIP